LKFEFTGTVLPYFRVTIPKKARERFGITKPGGSVKLVIEDYYPPVQTDEEIVMEVKKELEERMEEEEDEGFLEEVEEVTEELLAKIQQLAEEGRRKTGQED
jgi:bifunctional DNA-binding transcriptional regulator/antitoxin component of YhaV-PrlF toxin-antitoxin module